MYCPPVDDAGESGISDMDEYACPSGRIDIQRLLSKPVHDELPPCGWRPAYGGTCYSPIYEATPVLVTAYGATGPTATITYSASATDAQAYALPIDGFAYGVAEVASLGTAATTGTASSSLASSTPTSSAAAATCTVSNFTK
ncbi:unnamed protein product [Sphagnum balticum]